MGTLPARQFHEVAAQLLFPGPERAAPEIAALGVGLSIVHRGIVDLESGLIAAIMNVGRGLLYRVITRHVDAMDVHIGVAVGHHVHQHLGNSGSVLDPDRFRVPKAAHHPGFADGRATVSGDLQQPLKEWSSL